MDEERLWRCPFNGDRCHGNRILVEDPKLPSVQSTLGDAQDVGHSGGGVIVEIEGTPVETEEPPIARFYDCRPGDTVRL